MKKYGLVFVLAAVFVSTWALAQVIYTEEMLRKMLQSEEGAALHDIMRRQRDRLAVMQDAFLLGDSETLEGAADGMISDMRALPKALPPEKDTAVTWRAMSEIVLEAEQMKIDIGAKDYRTAYSRYANILGQCVRCHQDMRGWGVFEEPVKEEKKDDEREP